MREYDEARQSAKEELVKAVCNFILRPPEEPTSDYEKRVLRSIAARCILPAVKKLGSEFDDEPTVKSLKEYVDALTQEFGEGDCADTFYFAKFYDLLIGMVGPNTEINEIILKMAIEIGFLENRKYDTNTCFAKQMRCVTGRLKKDEVAEYDGAYDRFLQRVELYSEPRRHLCPGSCLRLWDSLKPNCFFYRSRTRIDCVGTYRRLRDRYWDAQNSWSNDEECFYDRINASIGLLKTLMSILSNYKNMDGSMKRALFPEYLIGVKALMEFIEQEIEEIDRELRGRCMRHFRAADASADAVPLQTAYGRYASLINSYAQLLE